MPLTDTRPAAQVVQLQVHRAMSGEQRLLMALEMSLFARELTSARIRQEHPQWSEAQVAGELLQAGISALPAANPHAMSASAVFRKITSPLDQAGIAYMLSGSFSSAYHGAPRSTPDIDLESRQLRRNCKPWFTVFRRTNTMPTWAPRYKLMTGSRSSM